MFMHNELQRILKELSVRVLFHGSKFILFFAFYFVDKLHKYFATDFITYRIHTNANKLKYRVSQYATVAL